MTATRLRSSGLAAFAILLAACSPSSPAATDEKARTADAVDAQLLFGPGAGELMTLQGEAIPAPGGEVYLTSRQANPAPGFKTGGPHVVVPKAFEADARGRTIRVGVTAKADPANPTGQFAVAYSTAMAGNSGWQAFEPTSDFKRYTFDYAVSPYNEKPANFDYIGINADTSGRGGGLIVSRIDAEILDE